MSLFIMPDGETICDCYEGGHQSDEGKHFKIRGVVTAWKNHLDGRLMLYGERHPARPLTQEEAVAFSGWISRIFAK